MGAGFQRRSGAAPNASSISTWDLIPHLYTPKRIIAICMMTRTPAS